MRYEKAEIIHRIALDMQGSAEGMTLDDIRARYSDKPLSRRTAERLRDAVERLFPIEHANPGELPKRWRLHGASVGPVASVVAAELVDLATAASVLRRENMLVQAESMERISAKLRAMTKRPAILRIEPDLEALTEAEGLGLRPGPRPKIDAGVVATLRRAILAARSVRIHYLYRASGKRGFTTVHPYGFLYGNRHYLVAWSESRKARDFRNFALSNIERVEILDEVFTRQADFSLSDYATRCFGVFQEEPFDVEWRFDAEVADQAREFLFHPSQAIEAHKDGSLIVRFRAGGALEMAWHLYTWGPHVEVIQPKDFWERVEEARKWATP